jgi:hypothetical protein
MTLFDESLADAIGTAYEVSVTRVTGAVVVETLSISDVASPGFVRWKTFSDSASAGDQLAIDSQYNRDLSDTLSTADTIHTWMAQDRVLQAALGGTADLQAVLVEKQPPAVPVIAPPRVAPKPVPVFIEHNVVIPNPPRPWED